jgi:hypothetical protein
MSSQILARLFRAALALGTIVEFGKHKRPPRRDPKRPPKKPRHPRRPDKPEK